MIAVTAFIRSDERRLEIKTSFFTLFVELIENHWLQLKEPNIVDKGVNMFNRKFLNMLVSLMVLTSLLFGGSISAAAKPIGPTDETKVPHYFGPYPNWANSPFTLPDATVTITGNGTGATAEAVVGANGAITAIHMTDPGSG
jgi:hypothetical protein